jgi:hypothetical protein
VPIQERRSAYAELLNDQSRNSQPVVEESALLRDLIFVSQGIDGKMIKFDAEAKIFSMDPSVSKEFTCIKCSLDWTVLGRPASLPNHAFPL